jgi:hypothetical protein
MLDRHTGSAAEWATTIASDMRRTAAESREDDADSPVGDDGSRGLLPPAGARTPTEKDDVDEGPIAVASDVGDAAEDPLASAATESSSFARAASRRVAPGDRVGDSAEDPLTAGEGDRESLLAPEWDEKAAGSPPATGAHRPPPPTPASPMVFPFERDEAFVLGPEAFTRDGRLIALEPGREPDGKPGSDTPAADGDPLPPAESNDPLSGADEHGQLPPDNNGGRL